MSACAQLNYNNVTPAVWSCVSQLAINHGGPNPFPNSGSFSKSGFTFAWSYDPGSQTAWVQCTDSPWIVPCSSINSALQSNIDGCYQSSGVTVEAFA
ncbi:hypothetical protein [Caulobacter sp. RL271]|jgi:hypothetical protein|uniref:Uncharacterized protein n=1 Tax=Caulobacter segnis TaxID=88688 RepID=A0ABY4ZWK2_9CAUL|nr:hypothetical protein [Caulobacter segnis]USQ97207.1 hypothetical protein MZV50_06610 [Caulobacter segnis]